MKAKVEREHVGVDPATESRVFQVSDRRSEPRYVDPECADLDSYDASERDFAISLEKTILTPRFVVTEHKLESEVQVFSNERPVPSDIGRSLGNVVDPTASAQREFLGFPEVQALESQTDSDNSWRQEVSARLSKYQSRRRAREPRYPSLRLKFEPLDSAQEARPLGNMEYSSAPNSLALAMNAAVEAAQTGTFPQTRPAPAVEPARIIEFPRSSSAPLSPGDELAEPVFDRPRIMEAPDIVPASPALGGILIEPIETPTAEKRPGFEMPLQSVGMGRRLAATAIDGLIMLAGLTVFSGIFWEIAALIPAIRLSAAIIIVAGAMLWTSYQYLLIVHCGTTPGLGLASLHLSNFDGTAVSRKMRRWRVLASVLSAVSLGLGYLWCFLDEDQLCWHDRITRTYIAPM